MGIPLTRQGPLVGMCLALVLAACQPTAAGTGSTGTASTEPGTPTGAVASPSVTPGSTPIPGFEGWTLTTPGAVDVSVDIDSLLMTLTHRALWFQSQRGVLLSTPTTGDFRISATVGTRRTSNASRFPGGDGTVQFAGIMARQEGVRENYVFIVVGSYTGGLAIETKSTKDNATHFEDTSATSGLAQLKLCRIGSAFTLAAWPADAAGWQVMATYDRPDLAPTLQVGFNIYSDATPDLTARYKHVKVEPLAGGGSC